MRTTARRWWRTQGRVLLVAFASAVGLWACKREVEAPSPLASYQDCQQDSILIFVRAPQDSTIYETVTAGDMPLIKRIANLPEYHDCQRFVVRPPGASRAVADSLLKFGPLVAIWAADSLGVRFPGSQAGLSKALPVAIIHNYDQSPYTPLGLAPGFSCLYLWHDGGNARQWTARIVSRGRTPSPCQQAMDPRALAGGTLTVKTVPLPNGVGPGDVPEVARWDWDASRQEQYIGIRCGDQWCEIGNGQFTPSISVLGAAMLPTNQMAAVSASSAMANSSGTIQEQTRVVGIKGWYDQQRLDLRDQTGKPVITNIVGTVIPHPALGRVTFTVGVWTPVAFINVTHDYPGKVPLRQGLSTMYLCKETAGECHAQLTAGACPPEPATPGAPPTTWWSRIVPAAGAAEDHCIRRRMHGGKAIPAAAARWNWWELDAKTWVACDGGCCTVN